MDPRFISELSSHIKLVVCNFLPIPPVSLAGIDDTGQAAILAAIKNFPNVGVVVDPNDYGNIVGMVDNLGALDQAYILYLAKKAALYLANYTMSVKTWFVEQDLAYLLGAAED